MCIVCVSVTTVATLISPTEVPAVQININDYTITKKACSKSKVNIIKDNKICLKNGKVYRWHIKNNVVETEKPTPSSTNTPETIERNTSVDIPKQSEPSINTSSVYSNPSVPGDNVASCKLNEASQRRGFTWAGFPNVNPQYINSIAGPVAKTGTVKWALIPVDFSDLPGEEDWRSRVDTQMKLLSEWVDSTSEGKFKVEWVVAKDWITLPGSVKDYNSTKVRGVNNSAGGINLFKTSMRTADPYFDFTNIQTVNFILPKKQNILSQGENGFPWDQHVKDLVTNEGRISSFTIIGEYQTRPDKSLWSYWFHEFGHGIGIAHVGGNGPEMPLFNPWEIMANQDGTSLELSGWLRFLSGWMSDERVYCKKLASGKVELDLVPLSNNISGIKLAIFPLSSTKALLIESRRVTKFSCTTPTARNGVLVYVLDLTLGNAQDFLAPVSLSNTREPERATCNGVLSFPSQDILLYQGEKVTFQGLTVEFVSHKTFDKVVVSK